MRGLLLLDESFVTLLTIPVVLLLAGCTARLAGFGKHKRLGGLGDEEVMQGIVYKPETADLRHGDPKGFIAVLNPLEDDKASIDTEEENASRLLEVEEAVPSESEKILWATLIINVVFTSAQLVAGYISNSVSLQGDSADMVVDSITCTRPHHTLGHPISLCIQNDAHPCIEAQTIGALVADAMNIYVEKQKRRSALPSERHTAEALEATVVLLSSGALFLFTVCALP